MTEGIFDLSSKRKIEEVESDPLEGMTPDEIVEHFLNETNGN